MQVKSDAAAQLDMRGCEVLVERLTKRREPGRVFDERHIGTRRFSREPLHVLSTQGTNQFTVRQMQQHGSGRLRLDRFRCRGADAVHGAEGRKARHDFEHRHGYTVDRDRDASFERDVYVGAL